MKMVTVKVEMVNFSDLHITRTLAKAYKTCWRAAIKAFLTVILQDAPAGLPVLTGSTKASFRALAGKYQLVSLATSMKPNPKYMNQFGTGPTHRPVTEEVNWPSNDLSRWTWGLKVYSKTFKYNEWHSNYAPPFNNRNPQRPEPWNLLTEAREEFKRVLKMEVLLRIPAALRLAIRTARRRPQ